MSHYDNAELTFDGPIPEDNGWTTKMKVALAAVVLSSVSLVAAWSGTWVYFQINPDPPAPYGPLSYGTPAKVSNPFGEVPRVDDVPVPEPSIYIGDPIPILLERTIDCGAFECPSGGVPTTSNIRLIRVSTSNTAQEIYVLFKDAEINFIEDDDYIRGTAITKTVPYPETFYIPEDTKESLLEEEAAVSAWRIEATTTPIRPDGIPGSWTSQVFHAVIPELLEGD